MSGIRNNHVRQAATDSLKPMLVALVSVAKPRRQSLFFLLLFTLSFSLSADPPINEMLSQNLEQSNLLVSSISSGESVSIDLNLIKITPSIEGSISAEELNYLLYSSLISLYSKDMPDLPDCGKRLLNASIKLDFIFTINNLSKVVSYSLTDSEELPKNILIPFSEAELSLADANDSLNALIEWNIQVNFENYEVYSPGGEGVQKVCKLGQLQSESYSGFSNISYKVEGGNILFFLSKPVLKQQWFENNHFDSIILSKRRFYKGEIFKNDEKLIFAQLYLFDTSYDQYGLLTITLIKNSSKELLLSEAIAYNVPVPLESTNESFSYAYMFNSTYEGIGKNNLTILLHDTFGNEFTQTYEIESKALLSIQDNPSSEEKLAIIIVPVSMIGILLILVFFRFRK